MNGSSFHKVVLRDIGSARSKLEEVERVLAGESAEAPKVLEGGESQLFDTAEQGLSLAMDALLSAIDTYREEKARRG